MYVLWYGAWKPEYMFSARQRLGKQVPAATNKQATKVLLSYNDGNSVSCWVRPEPT
jgi:hypothetical protein